MSTVAPFHKGGPAVCAVRFDRVYGTLTCYPVNEAAKLFAAIAGTRTLRPRDLANIERLGYKLVVRDGALTTLDHFMRHTSRKEESPA